jgi:hypothetical protein
MKVTIKTVGGIVKEFLDVDSKLTIQEFSKNVMEQFDLTDKYESIKLISKGEIMKNDDTLEKFNGVDPVFVCAPKLKPKVAPKPVDEPKPAQSQQVDISTQSTVLSQQIQDADMSKFYNIRQIHMTVCMFLEFITSHPQLSEMQKQNPSLLINIVTNPKMIQLIQQLADQSTGVIEAHDSGKTAPSIKITGFNLTNDGPILPTIPEYENVTDDNLEYNGEGISEDLLEKMTQLLHSGMLGGMLTGASNIGDVSLTLTEDDKKNIDSLVEMTGVTKGKATQAYLACDKNLNDAANFLFQE